MGNFLNRITGLEAERRLRLETERRLRGTFYSTIEDVWEVLEVDFDLPDLDAIRRSFWHLFYLESINAALADTPVPAYASSRSEYDPRTEGSSLQPNSHDGTEEKSRKRRLHEISIDGSKSLTAEVAHLIPYPPSCAKLYWSIAEAAAGHQFHDEETSSRRNKRRQVLIHGHYETKEGRKIRKDNTGIKHCRTNMARLVAQKQFLDFNPSMLILPIMTRDAVLDYKGGAYDVLVACTNPDVYRGSLIQDLHELCSSDDIKTATETLRQFCKGIAASLVFTLDNREIKKIKTKKEQENLLQTKKEIEETKRVKVPVEKNVPVKLAKLRWDMKKSDSHQETDLFMLLVKATVVWSAIQSQKLLPGGPPPHDL